MPRLRRFGDIKQLEVQAADDPLGNVRDIYFDCESWLVRYIAVRQGLFPRHQVHLIPAVALEGIDDDHREILVQLTQDEVVRSPLVDTRLAVTRQIEREIYDYYKWPVYWEHEYGRQVDSAHSQYPLTPPAAYHQGQALAAKSTLCSLLDFGGYVLFRDGSALGRVKDIVIETGLWRVAYIELDRPRRESGNQWLDSQDVKYVDWTDKQVIAKKDASVIS